MKRLLLTTTITLGLVFSTADASIEILDRHLASIDYDTAGEGAGVGRFTEAEYKEIQIIKAKRAKAFARALGMDVAVEKSLSSTRNGEDAYVD